jgi:snurportin-1
MAASDLYPHLLDKSQFFHENVDLDGINFYYPQSLYTPGESPLVLWLKPFMIPDVLRRPVNDQLVVKPPNYVNIFEFSQSLKKKNKRNKKKKNASNCEKMEVDNLIEVSIMNKKNVILNYSRKHFHYYTVNCFY